MSDISQAIPYFTDLHSHILPGIDDGAKNADISVKLLDMEISQGVRQLVLTPHFNCEQITVEEFTKARRQSALVLLESAKKAGIKMRIKLGAEVYFSPMMPKLDLKSLCIQGTSYLLVELPVTYNPSWTQDIFFECRLQGVTPLVAHVERYPYIIEKPDILFELVSLGAIAQGNAASIIKDDKRAKLMMRFFEWDILHVISSDTHSVKHRPPYVKKAYEYVSAKLGEEKAVEISANAAKIFAGKPLELNEPTQPKKRFGKFI